MDKAGFSHESTKNKTVEWYTPKYIFDAIGIFFDLDPCSPGKDIVPWVPARQVLTIADDGLMAKWTGNVWLNPPYGPRTPYWLERLALHGTGIALLFARTDAKWFHSFVSMADAVCFVRGRIRFVSEAYSEDYANQQHEPKDSPGAGSMLIAYGKENAIAIEKSGLGLTFTRPH